MDRFIVQKQYQLFSARQKPDFRPLWSVVDIDNRDDPHGPGIVAAYIPSESFANMIAHSLNERCPLEHPVSTDIAGLVNELVGAGILSEELAAEVGTGELRPVKPVPFIRAIDRATRPILMFADEISDWPPQMAKRVPLWRRLWNAIVMDPIRYARRTNRQLSEIDKTFPGPQRAKRWGRRRRFVHWCGVQLRAAGRALREFVGHGHSNTDDLHEWR